MREVVVKQKDHTTIQLKSPWLSIKLSCLYLDISYREFMARVADNVAFKVFGNRRKYHVADLDKYDPAHPEKEKEQCNEESADHKK